MIECDVLVVGAGPAGCAAARATARGGAKTILIEEHKKVGVPVHCAEGIGRYLLPFLPFRVPKSQLKWGISGMTFWAEDILIKRDSGIWSGYSINRTEWDQWLASLAINAGANLKTDTKLLDVNFKKDHVITSVSIRTKNKISHIKPKILIAADGVESTVVEKLGVKQSDSASTGAVKSYEMQNLNLMYANHEQLYFGDFAPLGYGYIFPLSKKRANIGVGAVDSKNKLDDFFEEFTEIPLVKKQIEGGACVVEKSGDAPIRPQTKKWNYGNVLLVGDSATQNFKPFVEGILPATICGDIAGIVSCKHLYNNMALSHYRGYVFKKLGSLFNMSDQITDILYTSRNNKDKNLLSLGLSSGILRLKSPYSLNKDKGSIKEEILGWDHSNYKKLKTQLSELAYLSYLSLKAKL
ncbi:MAG: NAD(P)/FAD-dependent oxidoreductase [archaeon]